MAIRSFTVGPLRGLQRATAQRLGNLVVVAGPNGAGKSSLLDLLRSQRAVLAEPGTEVLFVGPHRSWRASTLSRLAVHASTGSASYRQVLGNETLPSFQVGVPGGLHMLGQFGVRTSAGSDDAQAFVKIGLVKLHDRQQSLVNAAFNGQGGQVAKGSVPNLLQPFAELVEVLLPHLTWDGVDDSNDQDLRCMFRPVDHPEQRFDIDELSSGEKAVVALLLPLVEGRAGQLIEPPTTATGVVPLTMLLDEPEIHLHPLLQLQVLAYLRDLAERGVAQFILSTHSPTLLDALTDDELYLMSPAALAPENQLSRLTTNTERLEIARQITGATHLLTRAKPIVFVEGEANRNGLTSDAELIPKLLRDVQSWALVPGRSKRDVVKAVTDLRHGELSLPGVPVFGIVDADTDDVELPEYVLVWPVAMVENLLLDAEGIYAALKPYGDKTRATTPAAVQIVLDKVALARVDDEVRLRIQRQLPVGRIDPTPTDLDDLEQFTAAKVSAWRARLDRLDPALLMVTVRTEVDGILQDGTALARFHGKKILRAAYDDLGVTGTLSHAAFPLAVAATEAAQARAHRLGDPPLRKIKLFFPAALPGAVRALPGTQIMGALADRCQTHLDAWTTGAPKLDGRAALREEVFTLAREQTTETRQQLVHLASQIGTA